LPKRFYLVLEVAGNLPEVIAGDRLEHSGETLIVRRAPRVEILRLRGVQRHPILTNSAVTGSCTYLKTLKG